ncbi:NAD(P)H-dependent oxidoreductase [Desulfovibrio ferrophilus]|uniref:NAD(P)H dehydrogenase (Quinone) n=1 Tax=Desulfovibrio ferrophilus TaxID=241368 RepID=A0A2Z6AWX4_9BACT|nr:NAD(P)H-dependent oxidoreductase [Desulfovibrio ferrophilus]BBD07698.1 NAD(P)H dehydrogenase (quinone) [Desulfovibrio ferrophilus]
MNILVILGHPEQGSLNHAIAEQTVTTLHELGHQVVFHDLCREGFDPGLPGMEISRDAKLPPEIQQHCNELADADGIVIIHPNWWGMPPAILKGWVDRIMRVDVAYRFVGEDGGEGVPEGLLKADRALVFNTSNTATEREQNIFGDPLERIWKDCIFDLCGVREFHRRMFNIVCLSSQQKRESWLSEVRDTVSRIFPSD